MNSDIFVFKSYLKGNKTIKGNFPIYTSSTYSNNLCNVIEESSKTEEDINALLQENPPTGLITQDSNDVNTIVFLVSGVGSDAQFIEINK
jgi:hypothetical protein